MNGVWRWAPSRNIPECHSKSGLDSRNSPLSSSIGSVRQASPRLNGPRPIPMKSYGAVRGSASAVKGLSQVLLGVAGDQIEDGGDVGRGRLGVEQGELQVLAAADLRARHHGLTRGEQGLAGVQIGPVDVGGRPDAVRDVAEDQS